MHRHGFSYLYLFIGIVFLLYSPILFAGFAGDDIYQLVRPDKFHNSANLVSVFDEVIASPNGHTQLTGFFYRPLTYAVYIVLYTTCNGSPLPFHIMQLVLFAVAVYLIFLFFKQFFSYKLSFLLSLIFLIHPANNELAAYIAALSDTLCLLFGISILLLIGKTKEYSAKRIVAICVLSLLCLLSKETGAIFIILASMYALYKKSFKKLMLPLTAITIVYLLLRANASSHVMLTYLPHPVTYRSAAEHIFLSIQIAYSFIRELIAPTRDAIKPHAFQLTLPYTIFHSI
jgi:hypothetical protein